MSERKTYWRELINDHEASGLSIADFCEWQKVSAASFYQWKKGCRNSAATTTDAPMFVSVSVVDEANASSIAATVEFTLHNGCVLRVVDDVSAETPSLTQAAVGAFSC